MVHFRKDVLNGMHGSFLWKGRPDKKVYYTSEERENLMKTNTNYNFPGKAWEPGTGMVICMATCSICGQQNPMRDMHININTEEERCRGCFERYGDIPLETLNAALCVEGLHIFDLSRKDLDGLVFWQEEKIALNRQTDERILKLNSALPVYGPKIKIKKVEKEAKKKRDKINQKINELIKGIKKRENPLKEKYAGKSPEAHATHYYECPKCHNAVRTHLEGGETIKCTVCGGDITAKDRVFKQEEERHGKS